MTNDTPQSGVYLTGEVDASATQITIGAPPSVTYDASSGTPNSNKFQFSAGGSWSDNGGTIMIWRRDGSVTDPDPFYATAAQDYYLASMIDPGFSSNPGGTFSLGGDPWVVGTADAPTPSVPEPASVATGLIGVVGTMFAFRRRRTAA